MCNDESGARMTATVIIKRQNYHTVKSDFILAPGFNPGRRAMFLISPVSRISLRFHLGPFVSRSNLFYSAPTYANILFSLPTLAEVVQ